MAAHGRKRKRNSSHEVPIEFDPVDSAAESLADAMIRRSSKFKAVKNKLKLEARKAAERLLKGKVKF